MESSDVLALMLRTMLAVGLAGLLWIPSWWCAGRLASQGEGPVLRALLAVGLAGVAYLTFVNLGGRLFRHSTGAAIACFAASAGLAGLLWQLRRSQLRGAGRPSDWRSSAPWLALALVLGLPQWLMAVSTPFWDEVASSAIHLTAPNQFAEGLFPPRHNALPDLPIKYHYGFTMLSGTARWLTGLSSNVCIDLVSTAIWIFAFLFVLHWLIALGLPRFAALFGSFAALLGGGLAWLYVPRLETYRGFPKVGDPSLLVHRYDPELGWWSNLLSAARTPVFHLRNPDGTVSNLPWDIANQFQQHAVALGIAVALVCAYVFVAWQGRRRFSPALLGLSAVCFGLLFLAHGVFGMVFSVSAGLLLLVRFLRERSRARLADGALFTLGVGGLALAHGGLFSFGPEYSGNAMLLQLRDELGYSLGGVRGFVDWNLAGFGIPLLLAGWAAGRRWLGRRDEKDLRRATFAFFGVVFLVSYLPPQIFYYSYGSRSVEEFTEVAKFFFVTHLAVALLAAFAFERVNRCIAWGLGLPLMGAAAVVPLMNQYAASFDEEHRWRGFYVSPYAHPGASARVEMGRSLARLKKSNRDVFFDPSSRESSRRAFLNELLIYGGSAFTLTPQRYERTGGFAIAREQIAERTRLMGRMARLLPGAAEEAPCQWLYTHAESDFALAPLLVRSRLRKALAEGYLKEVARSGVRALYAVARPTGDLDRGLHLHWQPRVVAQARSDWDADGRDDLLFHDLRRNELRVGEARFPLPGAGPVQLYVGTFAGPQRVGLFAAELSDTRYARGERLAAIVEHSPYSWSYADAPTSRWARRPDLWDWRRQVPLAAELERNGIDVMVAFKPDTARWTSPPHVPLAGPPSDTGALSVPVAGRFLPGAKGDLGTWSAATGVWTLQNLETGERKTFQWGNPHDILVPGDYDADGYDEATVWRRWDVTWYSYDPVKGTTSKWRFGTPTAVPLPADYDGDGRLDLAYWEPQAGEIHVSFSFGASVDRVIPVPPDSIPAFVNMY